MLYQQQQLLFLVVVARLQKQSSFVSTQILKSSVEARALKFASLPIGFFVTQHVGHGVIISQPLKLMRGLGGALQSLQLWRRLPPMPLSSVPWALHCVLILHIIELSCRFKLSRPLSRDPESQVWELNKLAATAALHSHPCSFETCNRQGCMS